MGDRCDDGRTRDLFEAELRLARAALARAAGQAHRAALTRPTQRAIYEARAAVQRALDLAERTELAA